MLIKYLENIIKNPDEEKYRKVRLSNRYFQEKVAGVEGAKEFLEAAGFEQQSLPFNDKEESFLVFKESALTDLENLQVTSLTLLLMFAIPNRLIHTSVNGRCCQVI